MSGALDFQALNEAALAHCPGLLETLLPGGKLRGAEYVCGNLSGGPGDSCSVNVHSGKWGDFAVGQSGGDLISLVAEQRGVTQVEAARLLGGMVGRPVDTPPPQAHNAAPRPQVIMPVLADVSPPAEHRHPRLGTAAAVYQYEDMAGRLLGFVARFTKQEMDSRGKPHKEFAPRVYTAKGWRWQGFPAPRPLYGLPRLAKAPAPAPVVVVEGEAKTDALQAVLGQSVAVLGLFGGSGGVRQMDFAPLAGRRVVYWPDADAPGAKAALLVCYMLERAGAAAVSVAVPPEGAPHGWDCGDAVGSDGWDYQRLVEFLRDASVPPADFATIVAARWNVDMQRGRDTATVAPAERPPLRCVDVAEFLSLELPERERLLAPVLPKQGLVMLHAARGIGKTFLGLSMAYAVASGGGVFGRWQAPAPAPVLYLDGEMPARTLQRRIASIVAGNEAEPPQPDFLRFLTPDLQPGPMPNVATAVGQCAIEPFLEGVSLVVVDNLATLARHGRSNDEESWIPVQGWLLELRRRGLSVLLIHHQGKGGDQRGTSAKEDVLDSIIRLDRPRDYRAELGAVFEVRLTKARGIFGDDAKPFEAQLVDIGKGLTWTTRDLEDADIERLRRLLADGYSIRDASEEMGKSKSAIARLKKKLDAAEGRISRGTVL